MLFPTRRPKDSWRIYGVVSFLAMCALTLLVVFGLQQQLRAEAEQGLRRSAQIAATAAVQAASSQSADPQELATTLKAAWPEDHTIDVTVIDGVSEQVGTTLRRGEAFNRLHVSVTLPPTGSSESASVATFHIPADGAMASADSRAQGLQLLVVLVALVVWLVLLGAVAALWRRQQGRLRRSAVIARRDQLTGLPNRRRFAELINASVAAGQAATVAIIDIKGFNAINDNLGHDVGDELLRQFAGRLREVDLPEGNCARIGSDEFGLLRPGPVADDDLARFAHTVLATLSEPFAVGRVQVEAKAAVGVAHLLAGNPEGGPALRREADIALHQARTEDRSWAVYDPDLDRFHREQRVLGMRLRQALDDGELTAVYQPQMDTTTGRIHSVEALVRWRHPEQGVLSPGLFLPAVEHTELIHRITEHVLSSAIAQCAAWRADGQLLRVAVNLSARDAMSPELPGLVDRLLRQHGLAPEALTLELTESALLTDMDVAQRVLVAIDELGVEVSLDDFGTGHASIATLRRMPVSELKIDQSFVKGVMDGGADADVVQFTVDLGRRLHLRVVAEGAETAAEVAALIGLGCGVVQGHYFSHPLTAEEMTTWLQDQNLRLTVPEGWGVLPEPAELDGR